ncbi:MAG: hypothetical protein ACRERU_11845 [Methylococcales bacterium]
MTTPFQLAQRLVTAGQLQPATRIIKAKTLADPHRRFAPVGNGRAFQQAANVANAPGLGLSSLDLVL